MKAAWLESAKEDIEKAHKKYEIGDYKTVCILASKSAYKSLMSVIYESIEDNNHRELETVFEIFLERTGKGEVLREQVNFLKRFVLDEDVTAPLLAAHWNGLPDRNDAERALEYAKLILKYVEEIND